LPGLGQHPFGMLRHTLPAVLLLLHPAGAAAQPATRALMPEGLHSVITDADYPADAIQKGEKGAVQFRLDVGVDGRPTDCAILRSSGSATLDATTCRIMLQRPRFQPARDAQGRPVPDQIVSTLRWEMYDRGTMPPRMGAALDLWNACMKGEAAKLVPGTLSAAEIVTRALPACAPLGRLVSEASGSAFPPADVAATFGKSLETSIALSRRDLAATAPAAKPD
jgi:TonB family protein